MITRVFKVVYIICFLFISLSTIIIGNYPAIGYEQSIYSAIPFSAWLLLITSLFMSITTLILSLKNNYSRNHIILSFLIILLCNFLIISLPIIKGYYIYGREDAMSHLGYVRDIILMFHFNEASIYPLSHILVTEIFYLTNNAPEKIFQSIISIYYLMFVLFTYMFANVFLNKREALLATLASTVFILSTSGYYVQNMAMGLCSFLLPMFLYLYFSSRFSKDNLIQISIISIIVILSAIFLHPLVALFIFFILMIIAISDYLKNHLRKTDISVLNLGNRSLFTLPTILIVIMVVWISSNFFFWNNTVGNTLNWFLGQASMPSTFDSLSGGFAKLSFSLNDVIMLYLKTYGHSFLYILISLVVIIFISKKILSDDSKKTTILFVLSTYVIFTLFLIVIGIVTPTVYFYGWRYITLLLVITPIFVGLALNKLLNYQKTTLIIILFISITSVVGILSVYPSPYTNQMNLEVSNIEIVGFSWLISNRDPGFGMNYNGDSRRFVDAIRGVQYRRSIYGINPVGVYSGPLDNFPDHFGYDNNQTLYESMNLSEPIYFTLKKFDENYYTKTYKVFKKFSEIDFKLINDDRTINVIYNNGEMRVIFLTNSNV